MPEPNFAAFGLWSCLTIAVIVVTGLVYRIYRKNRNENVTS
ncbi:MAG TPA: hypothetical protein QGF01_06045 [Candidatus Nitrosopelagicus sp.]|nr:hypothetical protein [Candidatus Nitrosopelagicus sp.]MEC7711768.1 hypothetical protein [Thermoproteota archaeon]HJN20478.1 hypothetical protein [Candidatus Nitrosopelagicus sp.]